MATTPMNSLKQIQRTGNSRSRIKGLCMAAALTVSSVAHGQIFDFEGISTDPNAFIALPRIGTADDANVLSDLLDRQNAGQIVAARVMGSNGLSEAQQQFWFEDSGVNFHYLFADFEKVGAVTRTVDIAGNSTYLGNFNVDPLSPDLTQPNPTTGPSQSKYLFSRVNMSNENLYPGSPSFRSNLADPDNSNTPNARSDFFLLPVARFSGVEGQRGETLEIFNETFEVFPDDHKHVPYVTRFNNYGNDNLNTGLDSSLPSVPLQEGQDYVFDAREGTENEGQLLSRGDFSAQVAHYRLRGADGVVLFQPGVINEDGSAYTKGEMQNDARDGWNFLKPFVSDDVNVATDGAEGIDLESGVVWSGAYTDNSLFILASNMSDESQDFELSDMVNGLALSDTLFAISATDHHLLEFIKALHPITNEVLGWAHVDTFDVFVDDNRTGVGVPEPASLVMLAIGGLLVALPRSARLRR